MCVCVLWEVHAHVTMSQLFCYSLILLKGDQTLCLGKAIPVPDHGNQTKGIGTIKEECLLECSIHLHMDMCSILGKEYSQTC